MAQELVWGQLPAARHLRGDPDVLGEVEPRDPVRERPLWLRLAADEVVVGDPGDAELRAHRDPGPDRRARVHLDQLQPVVAGVADELDVSEPGVAGCAQEALPDLVHLGIVGGSEDGARAEAQRPLAHLAPDDAGPRLAVAADVGEERPDLLVRVRDELLHDRLEALVLRLLPGRDGLVEVGCDERLLAEGERELLALDGLQQERRAQARGADLLRALGGDGLRRVHAGRGCDLGQDVLAAQAPGCLRVVRQGHVGELADLVPAVQHQLDVLVALREEHGPLSRLTQHGDQPVGIADDAGALQVARAKAELVWLQRHAVDGNLCAPEAANDREPGVQEPEDDDRPHASASS